MTFSRMKNLTQKNIPNISNEFDIVINVTPLNAWFEGVSPRPWLQTDKLLPQIYLIESEIKNLFKMNYAIYTNLKLTVSMKINICRL